MYNIVLRGCNEKKIKIKRLILDKNCKKNTKKLQKSVIFSKKTKKGGRKYE
ncbi:MAG: hypothetical protein ACRC4J_00020 [Cetobacterium sp.]